MPTWQRCRGDADPAVGRAFSLWLGHESVETTQIHLDADLEMKQAVLDRTTPPEGKRGRYRPDDRLLVFLKGL